MYFIYNNYKYFKGFVIMLGKYIYTSTWPVLPIN